MAEIAEMAEKSGKSGRNFLSGPCCRYAFASVFACQESVPGFGNPATSLKFDRHTQVSRRLEEQSVESGRFRSG